MAIYEPAYNWITTKSQDSFSLYGNTNTRNHCVLEDSHNKADRIAMQTTRENTNDIIIVISFVAIVYVTDIGANSVAPNI